MYQNPSVDDFKAQFARDFPFDSDPTLGVTDLDIANAFRLVNVQINPQFYNSQDSYSIYYLLLAAHYLVTSLKASSGGVSGGWSGLVASQSVGSVSESYSIPQKYLDNPQFGFFASTSYGLQYLIWILPQLTGMIFSVPGSTRP